MMNVIQPKRLTSLESYELTLHEYSNFKKAPGSATIHVNGFTTVADLKRQIWIHHKGSSEWSPNRTWVAHKVSDSLYVPIDMSWEEQPGFEGGIPAPNETPGEPDSRLVDTEGNRKAIYPVLNEGLLLESIFTMGNLPELHVYSLESLIQSLTKAQLEDKGVLNGYIQLYFPKIQSKNDLAKPQDESYKQANEYIQLRTERIAAIDELLHEERIRKSEPFRLRHIRRWKAIIPKQPQEKSNDILFYEFHTSEHMPFLRFFPAQGRGTPLLKLATGPSGFPLVSDKDLLATFMEEEPDMTMGSVLVAKIPYDILASEVRAIRNTPLSIYWLEDGSSYAILEAPRRDMPLEFNVFEETQTLLKAALQSVGYSENTKIHLDELSASYRIDLSDTKKLSQKEILDRVAFFSPFLEVSTYQDKHLDKVNLKWKLVNNYEQEGAVYAYLTKRILEDDGDEGDDSQERVQRYVANIMQEFGRSEVDAKRLFDDWFRRRAEVVPTTNEVVSAHNTGVEIEITISHPLYFVSLVGVDSVQTFERVVSVMTAFFYYKPSTKAQNVKVPDAPKPPVVNKVVQPAKAAIAKPDAKKGWMGLLGANDEDDEDDEQAEEEEKETKPVIQEKPTGPVLPAPGDARKLTLAPLKEYWKTQLDLYDEKLFGYSQTDKSISVYSRTCQSHAARQPNVMVTEQLEQIMKEYGDSVEWVFLPPPENIILDVYELSNKDLIDEMTKRGFKDMLEETGKPKKKAVLQKMFEDALCAEETVQGQFCRLLRKKKEKPGPTEKPIWFVARAGTNQNKPNYYICTEYWCVRDMRPLLPSEFIGTKTRQGQSKTANSCPFCGGTVLDELKAPKQGQTVVKRKRKSGGQIHDIAGFMDNIHPNKFALPCCFTSPLISQLKPADGTVTLPPDRRGAVEVLQPRVEANEGRAESTGTDIDENEALTKVLRTIRTQYILKYEKRQLEPGRIGLCPPALDEMLGQVGSQSVVKSVGVAQHLKPTAKVFARFGLGNRGSAPGLNFLELMGFYLGNLQRAGKAPVKGIKFDTPTVLTPAAVLRQLFPENPTKENMKYYSNLLRAFERANYGNLVYEFAGNGDELEQGEIQKFAADIGISLKTENQHMRPHVVRLANAWHNFMRYVRDEHAPKDMSHFENLFAMPNVLFPNGLLLVVFQGYTDEEGNQVVKMRCPDYGISEYSQKYRPPISFLWHDLETGAYEPLIYIEGVEEKDKKGKQQYLVFPMLHAEEPNFSKISESIQDALRDFMKQYMSFVEGCGRKTSPAHPWMPDQDSSLVPRISELLSLKVPDMEPTSVLRDRSNRLVGVIYKVSESKVYIPALEDGSLGLQLNSVYDVESLPTPSLDLLLTVLTKKPGLGKLAGLKPVELLVKEQKYSALRLACGAIVPFNPMPISSTAAHPMFSELMKKGAKPVAIMPWTEDIRFLRMSQLETESMEVVPEALVEEAYQYLRISLSEWLGSGTRDAKKVLAQLRGLRDSKLPLYELRRRADILLEPIIFNWIDTSPHDKAVPSLSLLRRNCLIETKDTCETSPMCSQIGNECKIHAGTSKQVPDVKVYFTSRIIDEIMRYPVKSTEILEQSVSKISSPIGITRTKDEILTSKSKFTDLVAELDLDYVPQDDYSAGLRYPEDAHDEILGRSLSPERIELPNEWKKTGLYRIPVDPKIEDRLIASLTATLSRSPKQILAKLIAIKKEHGIQSTEITWDDMDWLALSEVMNTSIISVRYNRSTETVKPFKYYESEYDSYMIVFYVNDKPELLISPKDPLTYADLPKNLFTFLDSTYAITWDSNDN